jgi:hypothetical protein
MGHREVFFGNNRDVVRPENWIAPPIHFIHGDGDNAIAVGVFEREVGPRPERLREAFAMMSN